MEEIIKRLVEERASVVAQARTALDRAEQADAADYPEARASWQGHMDRVAEIDVRLADLRNQRAAEDAASEFRGMLDDVRETPAGREAVDEFRQFLTGQHGTEYRVDFTQNTLESRDLNITANANGEANIVAETFVRSLYEALRETSVVRELAQRVVTEGGEKMTFPKISGRQTASLVAEGAAIGTSDPAFTKASLDAYKYAFISALSHEMTTDPAVNVVPFLVAAGQEALGEKQAEHFMVGTGTSQPLGIFPGATQTVAAASASAIAFDELLGLKYKLKPKYRRGGVYVVNDSSVLALAKVKDADGNYAWKTSTRDGEPDTIHGQRVAVDPYAPGIAINARSVAFVDPARAYLIRDVGQVRVDRSTEFAYDTDEIAWRFIARADGGVWDANALAVLVHPAA